MFFNPAINDIKTEDGKSDWQDIKLYTNKMILLSKDT